MRLVDLDASLTLLPVDAVMASLEDDHDLAVLPVHDLVESTACLLVAAEERLWIASRVAGPTAADPPGVKMVAVPWADVGIGPLGVSGHLPGGILGGAAATDHLVIVFATGHLYEARMSGERGRDAVEGFASVARHVGAVDYEP